MLLEFINIHENWKELLSRSPYFIKIKQDGDYFLLKYDQLNSPHGDPLVNECRGCIVYFDEEVNEWIYVCRPFTRFYNYGEECAAKIDWKSARVLEKVDGSLIKVWHHNGWHVSTSGMIDAEKSECGDFNYLELFLRAALLSRESWDKNYANKISDDDLAWYHLNPQTTYLFELVSPLNKLVVPYESTELYYLGEINNMTGQEIYRPDGRFHSKEVKHFSDIYNLKDAIYAANNITADDGEGFVVVDKYFNRIKIKGEDYLRHFYYRNNGVITARRIITAMQEGWLDDLWSYNKDARQMILSVLTKVTLVGSMFDAVFNTIQKGIYQDQKDYAAMVKMFPRQYHGYLFYARKTNNIMKGSDWLLKTKNPSQIIDIINSIAGELGINGC